MLIEPNDLVKLISSSGAIIIDCRFTLTDVMWGQSEYDKRHIPGAHYAHLDLDLSAPVKPGKTGRHPLPRRDHLASLLGKWCVHSESTVVVYDQSNGGIAARAWWLLKWAGVGDVRLLNGGWARWTRNGLPVDDAQPAECAGVYDFHHDKMPIIEMTDVEAFSEGHENVLIDARASERYAGITEPIDPVAGRIPGAVNMPWMSNVQDDGVWIAKEQIRQHFADMQVEKGKSVAVYCGSGVTACHLAFAYEYADLGVATLYPGSWSEWITQPGNPIITEY